MTPHVVIGFSSSLLGQLDSLVPPGSVLLVEEPDVVLARRVRERIAAYRCFAGLVEAPTQDEHDPAGLVARVPRPDGVRVVLPAIEYGVVAAAALAQAWGLTGAGLPAARILRDKAELRAAADRTGLAQPRWRPAAGPADVERFRSGIGGSCVLKPANRQASLGVQLLGPADDVAEAWARTVSADEERMRPTRSLPARFLVEELLIGPEVSVECLVQRGRRRFTNVTAKLVQSGSRPVELGHVLPAALPRPVRDRLDSGMDGVIAATGFDSGVLHAEWILVDGAYPHLVECAGRLPGDSIDDLIDLAYGGSLLADLVAVLDGRLCRPRRPPRRAAAIRFVTAPPGVVRAVHGLVEAAGLPGIQEVEVSVTPGANIGPVASSWDRCGQVVATGAGPDEAAQRAAEALRLVAIETGVPV